MRHVQQKTDSLFYLSTSSRCGFEFLEFELFREILDWSGSAD